MTGKTKAAMPGRLSLNALLKHRQITRLAAGGQTLHSPVLARSNYHQGFKIRAGVQNLRSPVWGCSNHDEAVASDLHNSIRVAQNLSRRNSHAQIKLGDMPSLNNRVRLTYGHRNPLNHLNYRETRESANLLILLNSVESTESAKHEQYSGSPEHQHCLGSEVPTNNIESCEDNQPSLRGSVQRLCGSLRPAQNLQVTKSHSQNNPEIIGAVVYQQTTENPAVHSITESNPVQLSDSDLAFLRCRRLISPFTAVTMNCAFVSPSSRLLSKSATTSCGKRALSCCDLLLVEPVAIPESPCARCDSVYAKKIIVKGLKCDSLACSFKNKGAIHLVSAKPGSASTLTGPLTKPLVEVTVMAELQHTQTRPKYQYRFLALSAIGRNVIHITATTEREAREQSPAGCVMVFAGRLPVREARYA